jgi:hypothetical protein
MLLWRWLKRLGHKVKLGRKHGELTRIGPPESTIDSDKIAVIEQLHQLKIVVVDDPFGHHDLDIAGPVAKIDEVQFAGRSEQHDSARYTNLWADLFSRALAAMLETWVSAVLEPNRIVGIRPCWDSAQRP